MWGIRLSTVRDHVAQVRREVLVERRRHAEDQGIRLAGAREVGGGIHQAGRHRLGERRAVDVLDVALSLEDAVDLGLVDVIADDLDPLLGVADHEGKADVAQADDADGGGLVLQFLQRVHGCVFGGGFSWVEWIREARAPRGDGRLRPPCSHKSGRWSNPDPGRPGGYTIIPAATVSLVPGSMRMKEPVWRLRR